MSLLTELRHRVRALFQSRRQDALRAEEFQFHREQQALEYRRQGVPAAEADRKAAAAFGGRDAALEGVRDERGTRWLEDTMADLRYAVRQLRRSPGFTLVAVLTLALGIGANTAIFSVVDGVLLRPVTLAEADRLVVVWETDRSSGTTREPASYPDFVDFQRDGRSVSGLAGLSGADITLLPTQGDPVRISGAAMTHNYFSVIGIQPLLGRVPTAVEDQPNGPRVALLGEILWRNRFSADPAILGQPIRLNDREYTVIGVVPEGADFAIDQIHDRAAYHLPYSGEGNVDVWVPFQASEQTSPRGGHGTFVIGRLAPGATVASAQAEFTEIAARLEQSYPDDNEHRGAYVESLPDVAFGPVRPVLILLMSAVFLVLLVACVNVANLLLARGARRAREIAMRSALGAGLGRLGRQFVAETVLLTLLGAAGGVLVASLGLKGLLALVPAEVPRVAEVGIDLRVLLVALGISLLVGLGFGLVPTLQSLRLDVMSHVKGEGMSGTGSPRRNRLRNALVATELALSVMLVLSAGLLIRSFSRVMQVDPGFRPEGVLKAEYTLPATRYPRDFSRWPRWDEINGFNRTVLERTRSIPGVAAAAVASSHPLNRGFTNSWTIVGIDNGGERLPEISLRQVSPEYFDVMGSTLVAGRLFTEGDGPDQAPVGVINQTTARRFFGEQDPVGMEVRFWGLNRRIIGVVSDEKIHGLTEATPPAVYVSIWQVPSWNGALLAQTDQPEALISQLRQAVWSVDRELAVYGLEPLERTLQSSVGQRRFAMLVIVLFAGLTLTLALIGIYGVLSYATEQRTREIGIRAALGAQRGTVAGLVVKQGAVLTTVGIGAGIAGALAGSRLLESLLFGITRLDLLTHVMVPVLVLGAALFAMWVPAWRATRVSPIEALRRE